MKISLDDIELMTQWSKLELNDEEKIIFMDRFNKVLHILDIIQELKIDDIGLSLDRCTQGNVLREDEVRPSMDRDLILKNAQDTWNGMFSVPSIMD